jgi:hypothetical protein
MTETTNRLGLPLLVAGQGQKDITHNEALLAVDALLHPVAASRGVAAPPGSPAEGACWLVPGAAAGAWGGQDGRLACWTSGGWRFFDLPQGARLWIEDEAAAVRRQGAVWMVDAPVAAPAQTVADPSGGSVIDAEARGAILLVLARLRELGLILP